MSLIVNIYYTGKNGSAKQFAEEMINSGIVERVRAEEGNERYEYFFPMDDMETVMLIDKWRDQAALDTHHKTPMMQEIATLREKYHLRMRVEKYNEIVQKMNKYLKVSTLVLIVVVISAITTTILINNKKPDINPNLNQETTNERAGEKEAKMDKIYISINNKKLEINLEENSTTAALRTLLPLNIAMDDLNDNEKYAYLDNSLPTDTYSPKHIEAGDVMLFGDNCLVIFYKSFDTSYSYTKIGHIENFPELDGGNVSVNLSTE